MSRSTILAHIEEQDDGTATGIWEPYVLKSAFQPIFALGHGKLKVTAYEGLIRPFKDEQSVSPQDFFLAIPAAERLNVETLTRTLHVLNAGRFLDPEKMLFVNFDPSVFHARQIADMTLHEMRVTLNEAGIDPRRVVCEVTEQKSSSQQALAIFVEALRSSGFQVAIDDFGAEASDMERVEALRPNVVKFDARWISRLMETKPGFALLSVMVEEFVSKGITVIFEGIEENWQLEAAEAAGAHMVQGFLLARPEVVPGSFGASASAGATSSAGAAPAAFARHPHPTFGRRKSS